MRADPQPFMATLGELARLLPTAHLVGDAATPIARVHADTRSLQPGDLFVALVGERFDGHDFLPQARAAGAAALLAARGVAEAGLPGLDVSNSLDTFAALQQLATGWRAAHSLPLIAVTGSNGKTTVTQMIAAILRAQWGEAALATAGNFNNHIGVPLTLLRLRPHHRAAVCELGMNHPGEIDLLARIAQPTVALVNNAQREHQEFMDGVEAVARENGSVFEALPADGVAVFPAGDEHSMLWRYLAGSRRALTFGLREGLTTLEADILARGEPTDIGWALTLHTPAGRIEATLAAAGQHNLRNAAAAAACALAAGASPAAVAQGLSDFRPVSGRTQVHRLQRHGHTPTLTLTLVDDSYNANPDSVRAAVDVLAALPGPRTLVLGDMGEVGERGPEFHAEVGAYAAERGLQALLCVGPLCRHAAQAAGPIARHFDSVEALLAALPSLAELNASASVLVKGSRFMRMERVVQAMQSAATEGQIA